MNGYAGKILRVDLSNKTVTTENLDHKTAEKFIGGRGLATKILMDEVDPNVDPLSPKNKLIFMTGPLTGTNTPTGGRYMVVTKSPLTGAVANSNSGGYWGAEMKFAGYDGIIIEGKAESPVYINIVDDKVEIKDAVHLWGKVVSETTEVLQKEHGEKVKVATIGPAGENLSLMAAIMNDRDRAAGRSGVGAVMGSKNLKAITVKGNGTVGVRDKNKLKEVFSRCIKKIKENGLTGQGLPTYGTAILVNVINENGVFPTNNFQLSTFDKSEEISGETLTEKYLTKKEACFRCPIACGRYCEVDDIKGGGPEYETIWAFGADCGVSSMPDIIKANYWCNEMGLDTISAGATLAAAMELYQKGYIKKEEFAGGPELQFGNAEAVVEWTKRTGLSLGLGAKLAQGSYRLCESYGVPEISMTVKKMELPAYDPRGIQGHGLQYATCNRGGCHVRGYMIAPEIAGLPEKLDRFSLEGKPVWVKTFQDMFAAIDSLGLCVFTSFALDADDFADLYSAVCGTNLTGSDFLAAGDRVWTFEKLYNLKAGIDSSQDTLPQRLLKEPIPDGPSKGWIHKLDELLPEYYKVRGWDVNGVPTVEKLKELGL
ncbi:tungsten-containing aldehyde ferredoxin oxidoreductase Aor [Clostridium aceticum]|uniref:Tungsten-containing aldehyde ferredoxin oxidoreductase Aor n=1 Tax=Clostridium aceticum TaxID=84022 RepID=A0A0D8ICR0_9CLOT|nr:aldehyde ferredoxin oxidoreductase family protein [Clostridium aceticum]AKL96409.1 tungsten-containing aldehyde ferredoxin oxidoreductase Aor [Clostridium aceticum]KJF26981.1 aldehyde:ferredoxin oxidoreductase [Clostridium aceticum]